MPSFRLAAAGLGVLIAAWCAAPGCNPSDSASAGSGGTGAGGQTYLGCDTCFSKVCAAEETGCDDECYAIQACLDAVCANLSQTMSTEEGECQVHCQDLHPTGKAAHIAFIDCARAGTCQPPCLGYPSDYDQCVSAQNTGPCGQALDACSVSADCQSYQDCIGMCTSLSDCLGCGDDSPVGEQIYEALQLCIEIRCLPEGWLPDL